jgi:hypothetical protein
MTGMLKSGSFRLRPNACSITVLATSDKRPTYRTWGSCRIAGDRRAPTSLRTARRLITRRSSQVPKLQELHLGRGKAEKPRPWDFAPDGVKTAARSMEAAIETCANPVCRASALTDFSPVSLRASRARQAPPANAVTRIAPGSPKATPSLQTKQRTEGCKALVQNGWPTESRSKASFAANLRFLGVQQDHP